jgi:hypothetical protein
MARVSNTFDVFLLGLLTGIIVVAALRSKDDPNASLHLGNLLELYEMLKYSECTHSVNILDVPLGETSVPVPPQYRYVKGLTNIGLI